MSDTEFDRVPNLNQLLLALAKYLPDLEDKPDDDLETDPYVLVPLVTAETDNRRYTIAGVKKGEVNEETVVIKLEWLD